MSKQEETPIYDAVRQYIENRIVSFDVPGHKQGKGHKALIDAFGKQCVSMDLNSSKPLDNLTHPTGAIRKLVAGSFQSEHAFFYV